MGDLFDIVENNFQSYSSFFADVKQAGDQLYNTLTDYSQDLKIKITSHKADADGFGSQIVLEHALKLFAEFYGRNFENIKSDRVMSVSKNKESTEHLDYIIGEDKDAFHIFADLGTLNTKELEKLVDKALIIDHHKYRSSDKFLVVNPEKQGHKGQDELSAAMTSTLIIQYMLKKIEDEFKDVGDVKLKNNLKKLKENINYLSIYGMAGAEADQQKPIGINKAIYDYFENLHLIKKIDTSLYGFVTKPLCYVLAEDSIPFNTQFKTLSRKKLVNFLKNDLGYNIDEKAFQKHYSKIKFLFVEDSMKKKDENFGINYQFISNQNENKISNLSNLLKKITGQEVIIQDKNDGNVVMDSSKNPAYTIFYHFKEDIRPHKIRVTKAKMHINSHRFAGHKIDFFSKLEELHKDESLWKDFKRFYKENIIAFADPEKANLFLNQLEENQYCAYDSNFDLIKNKSISEISNLLTSFSKQGFGKEIMDYISLELQGKSDIELFEKIDDIHKRYRTIISQGMVVIEDLIYDKKLLQKIDKNVYYLNLDPVAEELGIEDLSPMTGVYGGIIATHHLPDSYGVVLTGLSTQDGTMKISSRVNPSIKMMKKFKEGEYHFGEYLDNMVGKGILFGGGGHPEAASCRFKEDNFFSVKNYFKKNEFGKIK